MRNRDDSPVKSLLNKESSERLDAMLNQLPQQNATALRLRFFGGLKFHEIATTMKCSLSSAKNRVRLGLTQLAEMIDKTNEQQMLPGTKSRPDNEVSS